MSGFDRIWSALKVLVMMRSDLQRLDEQVRALELRDRETRERLVFREGVVAGTRERAGSPRLPKR